MKHIITIAAAILTLGINSNALPEDFIDNGHYTTDTVSGLDWLDVNLTVDIPIGFIDEGPGTSSVLRRVGEMLDGWRYATDTEFAEMLVNFTGKSNPGNGYVSYIGTTLIAELQELIGITEITDFATLTIGILKGGSFDFYPGVLYNEKCVDFQYSQPFAQHLSFKYRQYGNYVGYPSLGNYLVRQTIGNNENVVNKCLDDDKEPKRKGKHKRHHSKRKHSRD